MTFGLGMVSDFRALKGSSWLLIVGHGHICGCDRRRRSWSCSLIASRGLRIVYRKQDVIGRWSQGSLQVARRWSKSSVAT